MATENRAPMATARAPIQASHGGPNTPGAAVSPPSKRELASWWKKFRKNTEKPEEKVETVPGIFGVPLSESIRYANVAISLTNDQGESFIYGYVPIVVAKCGVFLKEKATDVEGIFRLSGSAKRIKDLQAAFNSPDRYGKGLDWTGYTVHDAANILRRYLNQLPEPIVPLEFYDRFRDPIRSHQTQAVGNVEAQAADIGNFDLDAAVAAYQKLITQLPPLNRQLLLYILDLLAVFSSKSDLNRMTSSNLAAIFQPGIISHPSHDMSPSEYRLSQDVLIFLIENQDNFLIGMTGTAVDEKTVKDVESGPPAQSPARTPKANIARSASNASAGADSLRKHGVRRNVSVSSRASKDTASNGLPSPLTPSGGGPLAGGSPGVGVKRSNTVPSKKSPAITPSNRFQRQADPLVQPTSSEISATPGRASGDVQDTPSRQVPTLSSLPEPMQPGVDGQDESAEFQSRDTTHEPIAQAIPPQSPSPPTQTTQTRDRKFSNLFARSPVMSPSDSQGKDLRPPNKLKKKQRIPGSANESAQSSQASLTDDNSRQFHTPMMSPDLASHSRLDPLSTANPTVTNTMATPIVESPPDARQPVTTPPEHHNTGNTLMPRRSPEPSLHSRSSITDPSDLEGLEDPAVRAEKAEKRQRNWRHRFSSSAKKSAGEDSPLAPPPLIGQNPSARLSDSSVGSSKPRKSFTADSQLTQQLGADTNSTGYPYVIAQSSQESTELSKEQNGAEQERKGFIGKIRAKIDKNRDERKEREAEKERAKSPLRQGQSQEQTGSKHSLNAFTHEHLAHRGRSMDKSREEGFAGANHTNAAVTGEAQVLSTAVGSMPRQSMDKQAAITSAPQQSLEKPAPPTLGDGAAAPAPEGTIEEKTEA